MSSRGSRPQVEVARAIGRGRNATRAEQLRALGYSDRTIARQLGIDRDAVAGWFELQDHLVLGPDLDGVA